MLPDLDTDQLSKLKSYSITIGAKSLLDHRRVSEERQVWAENLVDAYAIAKQLAIAKYPKGEYKNIFIL